MTPLEVGEYARQQWNAVGDNFFSDDELYRHIYAAQMDLALKSNCIREVFTTPTVASQQEYARPTNAVKIKRILYDDSPLIWIPMDQASTTSYEGTPGQWWEWGASIFLDPIPTEVQTLKILCFNQPQAVTSTSTMEVPERYHLAIADYLIWRLALKEKNFQAASEMKAVWDNNTKEAVKYERTALRGSAFSSVQDVESGPFISSRF